MQRRSYIDLAIFCTIYWKPDEDQDVIEREFAKHDEYYFYAGLKEYEQQFEVNANFIGHWWFFRVKYQK